MIGIGRKRALAIHISTSKLKLKLKLASWAKEWMNKRMYCLSRQEVHD